MGFAVVKRFPLEPDDVEYHDPNRHHEEKYSTVNDRAVNPELFDR